MADNEFTPDLFDLEKFKKVADDTMQPLDPNAAHLSATPEMEGGKKLLSEIFPKLFGSVGGPGQDQKAAAAIALGEARGIPFSQAYAHFDELTSQVVNREPSGPAVIGGAGLAVGMMTAGAVPTLAATIPFVALPQLQDFFTFPEEGGKIRKFWETVDFIGKSALAHQFGKKAPDVVQHWTKEILGELHGPKTVFVSPETAREVGPDAFREMGIPASRFERALQFGMDVEVPAAALVTVVDRPWFAKLKKAVGLSPSRSVVGGSFVRQPGITGPEVPAIWKPPQPTPQDPFSAAVGFVFKHEGGLVNDPAGRGGLTNRGIASKFHPGVDVANLTQDGAREIYRDEYWTASGADKLPWPMSLVHFDTAVAMGPARAQALLAESGGDPAKYIQLREQAHVARTEEDPSQAKFLKGWLNRTADLKRIVGGDISAAPGEPVIRAMPINGRSVTAHSELLGRLEQANRDMIAATGSGIVVHSSFRTYEEQAAAYERYQKGEGGIAAPPGRSRHNRGLAVDVTNWKEAEPFLRKYGLVNSVKGDPVHFQLDDSVVVAEPQKAFAGGASPLKQEFLSSDTSLNQIAATFERVAFEPGTVNLDIGGGKFDKASDFLSEREVENLVFDPFNREDSHNQAVFDRIVSSPVDSVTVNNVLNVIKEPEVRDNVVLQAARAVKEDGTAYFLIHEGDSSGSGRQTSKGWQNNAKASEYLSEISNHFDSVKKKGNLIVASGPKKDGSPAQWITSPGSLPLLHEEYREIVRESARARRQLEKSGQINAFKRVGPEVPTTPAGSGGGPAAMGAEPVQAGGEPAKPAGTPAVQGSQEPAGLTTIAKVFKDIVDTEVVDLRGLPVESPADLAVLAQQWRKPYEEFRWVFIKDGRIVDHEGVSCRLPGRTKAFIGTTYREAFDYIQKKIGLTGADSVFMVHNHPSGDPSPSRADIELTQTLGERVPQIRGHVVINSGKYVFITPNPYALSPFETYDLPDIADDWIDPLRSVPKQLMAVRDRQQASAESMSDLLSFAKRVNQDKRSPLLIYTDARMKVAGLQEVKDATLLQSMDWMPEQLRRFGTSFAFLYVPDKNGPVALLAPKLVKDGYVADVIFGNGEGVHDWVKGTPPAWDRMFGGVPYEVIEGEPVFLAKEKQSGFKTQEGVELQKTGKVEVSDEKSKESVQGAARYDGSTTARIEAVRQGVYADVDKFADHQSIVTIQQAQDWLALHGFPRVADAGTSAELIGRLLENPDFKKLSIFDRIRVAAQLERPIREKDYAPVAAPSGNKKTTGEQGISIGSNRKTEDSGILVADTVAGCDNYCYECYALKGSSQSNISHQHPVLRELSGRLKEGEVLRLGEKGDPAKNWEHTHKQVSALIDRTNKAGVKASPEKSIFYITKLQNLEGFNPKTARNLQVTLDPMYPDHMIRSMENILRVKSAYPDVNITTRVRSFASTNAELQDAQGAAIDFANRYGIPVLETRMRFIRNSSFDLLELDPDRYKRVGNQYKLVGDVYHGEADQYYLCDVNAEGCPGCKNCIKTMFKDRSKVLPKQNEALKSAGIDDVSLSKSSELDQTGGAMLYEEQTPFGAPSSRDLQEYGLLMEDQIPFKGSTKVSEAEAKQLEEGEKIKAYRAMQVIDGKLYPPMSAKVGGKMREPTQIGQWERAEEAPHLATESGHFKLDKGNKSTIQARYNPYFHVSKSPLNDQFSSAYKRDNLVTVEVEVPKSELTSGYKAEKAKDTVGEMQWHSGPVSSKLPPEKQRTVILSRYSKVVRIVPDNEVAAKVADLVKDEGIEIPSNVVTPSLRKELEKQGVTISEPMILREEQTPFGGASSSDLQEYDRLMAEARKSADKIAREKIAKRAKKRENEYYRQAKALVDEDPVFQAMDWIANNGGLKSKALAVDYDLDTLKDLNRKRPRLIQNPGRIAPDEFAADNGFEDLDAMIVAFQDAPTKAEAIERQVEYMREENVEATERDEAEYEAILADEESKALAALTARSTEKMQNRPAKGLKQVIRRNTGQMDMSTLWSEAEALKGAMQKASRAAREAFRAGRNEEALAQKERQRLIAWELREKARERSTIKNMRLAMGKMAKDEKIPYEYREQIWAMLGPFRSQVKGRIPQPKESLDAFVQRMFDDGQEVLFDPELIQQLAQKSFGKLTIDEVGALHDAVSNVHHLGKVEKAFMDDKRKVSFDAAKASIIKSAIENARVITPSEHPLSNPTRAARFFRSYRGLQRELLKASTIFRYLDGWHEQGAWQTEINEIMVKATNDEMALLKALRDKYREIFADVKGRMPKWVSKAEVIPGFPYPLTKWQQLSIYAHAQHPDNLAALKHGFAIDGVDLADRDIQTIIDNLKPEERNVIDRLINEFFPISREPLAVAYKQMTGVPLKMVEGKYVPMRFDKSRVPANIRESEEAETAKSYFNSVFPTSVRRAGSSHERKGGKYPLDLSPSVWLQWMTETAHYATHVVPVRDVLKLIKDTAVRDAVMSVTGGDDFTMRQIDTWLRESARPGAPPVNRWERKLGAARSRFNAFVLGYKVTTALVNYTAIFNAVPRIGGVSVMKGMVEYYKSPGQMTQWIHSKDPRMLMRAENLDRDLRDLMTAKSGFTASLNTMDKAAFWAIGFVDGQAANAVWLGAYHKAINGEVEGIPAGDDDRATMFAGDVVEQTQGSGLPRTLAAIQRGGEAWKTLVSNLYGFMSTVYQLHWENWQKLRSGGSFADYLKAWFFLSVMASVTNEIMRHPSHIVRPDLLAKAIVEYRLGAVPIIRDAIGGLLDGFDFRVGGIGTLIGETKRIGMAATAKKDSTSKLMWELLRGVGMATGMIPDQAFITIEGAYDLMTGKTDDPSRLLFRESKEDRKASGRR